MNLTGAPRLARHHTRDYCAAAAVHLLRQREASYPGLITAGKLSAAAAAIALENARAVVAQWRWVIDPAAPPLPAFTDRGHFGVPNIILIDEIAGAAARACAIAARAPDDRSACELADLYTALAWYQQDAAGVARIAAAVEVERELHVVPFRNAA